MAVKRCSKCKELKSLGNFAKHKSAKTGLKSQCKQCTSKDWRERRDADPEAYRRSRYQSNWKMLGMVVTWDDLERKAKEQNYCCAICKDEIELVRGKFAYDHCHVTNKLRDVLCMGCNKAIGLMDDNPHLLRLAALYIERHSNES